MMIKCQKCGFENQMGSIFCRSCGEKLDMDAIDPNKLQKDVNKEKSIKLAKKRIKGLISALISLLFVAAFFFVILYRGRAQNPDYVVNTDGAPAAQAPAEGEGEEAKEGEGKEEAKESEEGSETTGATEDEKKALAKYDKACRGDEKGKVTYTYHEINLMFKKKVIEPLAAQDTTAKITSFELDFDAVKNQSVIYIWFKVGNKVPMLYTLHCWLSYQGPNPDNQEEGQPQLSADIKRLDIGLLPLFVSTKPFLKGFASLLEDDDVKAFFSHAGGVDFTADGVTIDFKKPGEGDSADNSDSKETSGSASHKAPGSSAEVKDKNASGKSAQMVNGAPSGKKPVSTPQNMASEGKKKTEERSAASDSTSTKKTKEKKLSAEEEERKALEEERKRKAEEYRQQKKEQEEERKRKAAEEAERKKQEREAEKQRQKEENDRRNEERRRERENRRNDNNYNRNSRNRGW